MKRLVPLLLLLASSAATLATIECALRVYQRVRFGIPILSVFPDYRVEPMTYSPFLAFGPRINYDIPGKSRTDLSRFDDRGFRTTRPLLPKDEGEIRIVALGGSTTEDLWNTSGRHWPWLLEQQLARVVGSPVRVLNGGMSAYATPHTLIRTAFDATALQTDVLLVMHNINDLTVVYHAADRRAPVEGHYRAKYLLDEYTGIRRDKDVVWSRLARLGHSRLARAPQPLPDLTGYEPLLDTGAQIFRRNLVSIAAVARAHGIEPVFMTMPFARGEEPFRVTRSGLARVGSVGIGRLPARERFLSDLDRYNQEVVQVGRTHDVPVVDMAGEGSWPDSLFVDTVHYSDVGSETFASRLAPHLAELLKRRTCRSGNAPCLPNARKTTGSARGN